ncbi:hypothetical protein E2542_SST20225 [Spatholobus suberectus]|nr:hypothetical protein E2542_SST20225 [Spatholobus suberectus]
MGQDGVLNKEDDVVHFSWLLICGLNLWSLLAVLFVFGQRFNLLVQYGVGSFGMEGPQSGDWSVRLANSHENKRGNVGCKDLMWYVVECEYESRGNMR